jgi:hypothetical protein
MFLLGIFASVALLMAATGTYGVLAYSVAERSREIGIRMALGSRTPQIVSMVLRQAAWIIGTGDSRWAGRRADAEPYARIVAFRNHTDGCRDLYFHFAAVM